ncbi:MAG: nitroreductase family protein [Thiomargarita sp.]|nr:nitroreductase family protein [Thiomargarita sp.]
MNTDKQMNSLWELIRDYMRSINFIRHTYKILTSFVGFMYDYKRFLAYGGWPENMKDMERRNYQQIYIYHRLEKSLSLKERGLNHGWNDAYKLLNLLNIARQSGSIGYHDKASKQILEKFIELPENINSEQSQQIKKELEKFDFNSSDIHGAMEYGLNDFEKGKLDQPEDFFLTRYSLREFQDKIVGDEMINRAVRLAMKTPSVCNRQAWHIYHTCDKEVKSRVLSYQNGNRPFGKNIPNLIVVTTDLKAFFSAPERYQHWIDGGLLSMSLMYSFHSLGIATCALNWGQSPKNDKLLRKAVNIKSDHTIIMILAIGYPDENNKVCLSARRPFEEIYSTLEKR